MDTNFWVIFTTGLLAGGLSCLAVQGGLLASSIARREEQNIETKAKPGGAVTILAFLLAKLFAYTILGFLLGWLGEKIQLTVGARAFMQFAAAIFMIGTAMNLLNVHPIFRYFLIQPPKRLMKLVRSQSKSGSLFAPILLGVMTVLIPCGTTQAMMALAIASGNAGYGAGILFAFVLGTMPLFFTLGYLATRIGKKWQGGFYKVSALVILVLAFYSLQGAAALSGIKLPSFVLQESQIGEANQRPTITIQRSGYSPRSLTVKAGEKVTLTLVNKDSYSCAQAFVIPRLGIERLVPPGSQTTIEFMAPKYSGRLVFSCSMGMYTGVINIL